MFFRFAGLLVCRLPVWGSGVRVLKFSFRGPQGSGPDLPDLLADPFFHVFFCIGFWIDFLRCSGWNGLVVADLVW